jgi:hypothetical protein
MATANNNPLSDLFAGASPSEAVEPLRNTSNLPALELRELGDAVARRTRSLVAPTPILELEADKSKRDIDLSRHDLRMLCLVTLDTVIDRMGFGSGATRRDIQIALAPILYASEPVSKFRGHWLTRGLDGNLYAEAFQESGGAWSSAAFRLELPTAKLTEVVTSLIAEVEGKGLEPKIWNATDTPSVFGLAIDNAGRMLAAVPGLAKVYRIEKNHTPHENARGEDRWRATSVAVFGDSISCWKATPARPQARECGYCELTE